MRELRPLRCGHRWGFAFHSFVRSRCQDLLNQDRHGGTTRAQKGRPPHESRGSERISPQKPNEKPLGVSAASLPEPPKSDCVDALVVQDAVMEEDLC